MMEHWLRPNEDRGWRHTTGGYGTSHQTAAETTKDDSDIMQSNRHLTETDICVVASQLGTSWRLLGLRLNYAPETLDAITTSLQATESNLEKMAERMLRSWSKLPTATVGRLAIVLWEMEHHMIALQLQP